MPSTSLFASLCRCDESISDETILNMHTQRSFAFFFVAMAVTLFSGEAVLAHDPPVTAGEARSAGDFAKIGFRLQPNGVDALKGKGLYGQTRLTAPYDPLESDASALKLAMFKHEPFEEPIHFTRSDWEELLLREFIKAQDLPAFEVYGSRGRSYFTIPARVGQILDSHSKTELLPFLTDLRESSNPAYGFILAEWIAIVSSEARGTPATVSGGLGSQGKTLSVFTYVVPPDPR